MGSEGMGVWELPEGWKTVRIGDYAVDVTSGFACAKKHAMPEGLPHLRPFNVGTDGKLDLSEIIHIPDDFKSGVERYYLQAGDILFNNTNSVELVGKSAIVHEPLRCAFSNHITRLRVDRARLLPGWLVLSLRQLWADGFFAARCRKWIGQAGFNTGMLADVEIPLPPLDEQRRIVARVEELFARIEEAQRLRAAADQDADSLLDATMTDVFSDQALSRWDATPLKHLTRIEAKLVDPTLTEYRDLPHINGNVIESVTCRLLPYNTAAEDGMISGKYLFAPGDVLYSKIRPYLRKATIVNFTGLCSADMYPLTVADDRLEPRFLMWSLVAPLFTEYAVDRSGRARMPKLNRSQLFSYPFPLPPPSEQHRIVEHLDGVQAQVAELKHLQAESAAELERLSGAVLARAFRGKL